MEEMDEANEEGFNIIEKAKFLCEVANVNGWTFQETMFACLAAIGICLNEYDKDLALKTVIPKMEEHFKFFIEVAKTSYGKKE